MASAISPRKEAINEVFKLYYTAKEQTTLSNLRALVQAIRAFISKSPKAFADLSGAIGFTEDLLLIAAAQAKQKKRREQFFSWENSLGNARLSRAGQTRPEWLRADAASAGVLLRWKAPSLDQSDESDESADDAAPEKLYGKNCECTDDSHSPHFSDSRDLGHPNPDMSIDFQDHD